ncbi:hypothetical protein PIROE2DRAFT_9772 [Piromyces sp. E2]|nr:hypothetical protein PIROE2DRAFT_9772 [Piromyces sp. E2]|eukprot:OUM63626.1 hypothetical protein PIROE2DRAFT_9772 [Piromyces sp. E2]
MIGNCEFNNLRLFLNPDKYQLIFKVESSLSEKILFDKNSIQFIVKSCDDGQYNVYDQNNILVCENPICNDSCPVNSTAKCIISDGNIYSKNIIKHNICKCNEGWAGELCDIKIFVDFSNFFSSQKDQSYCELFSIFKHTGISFMYYITLIYIYSGYNFGIIIVNDKKKDHISITQLSSIESSQERYYDINEKNRIFRNENEKDKNIENLKKDIKMYKFLKSLKKVRMLYAEGIVLLIFSLLLHTIMILTYSKNNDENEYLLQNNDGKWSYRCPIEKYNIFINTMEVLLIIILVRYSFGLWARTGLFKNTFYMSYAVILWIAFGPAVNVIHIY